MFKNNSFENEIYRSMEKSLIKTQTEEQYGFNKLARAVDYLHAASSIFEQAGMQEESNDIANILKDLASQLSKSANETHHKRCNCENSKCKHDASKCKNKADDKKAMYVGSICNDCAKLTPKEYLK